MNIVHLTAGAGGWYCGTCIRDNGLVGALRRAGADARLVPLYLPILSEGPSCSASEPVLMSGINVWLQENVALFRQVPRWMDAVLATRPVLGLIASQAGRTRPDELGPLTVGMLRGEEGNIHKEVDRLVDHLAAGPRPDVIVLSNSLLAGLVAPLQRRLGVPVVVTIQGELHFVEALGEPWTSEAWSWVGRHLQAAAGRVAVSRFAADATAARAGVDPASVDVVPNGAVIQGENSAHGGTSLRGEPGSTAERPLTIGFLARLTAEKGLDAVVPLFARLAARAPALRLLLVGTVPPGRESCLEDVLRAFAGLGLDGRVEVHRDVSPAQKGALLDRMDVLCVPTAKDETFGTYLLEAMARGVPVVAPARGAIPEVVGDGGALYPPGDLDTAAALVEVLLSDPGARAAASAAALSRARAFEAEAVASRWLEVLGGVLHRVANAPNHR